MQPLDDVDAIDHAARTAIPLGQDEHITGAQAVDGPLQLGPVGPVWWLRHGR